MTTMREALQTETVEIPPPVAKFCRDCKYKASDPTRGPNTWRCTHPMATPTNALYYVTGNPAHKRENYTCEQMREGICAQGLYYEPRE